jgi:pilus assembly protein TadC
VRSGVSLYDAFLSISEGGHGAISNEFKEITKKISVGVLETKALEEVMIKNPSTNFRRALWQIANAIESGADIGNILEELVKEFSIEHRTAIKMYGAQLNSLALVYMIFAIIAPSIGVCFLIILSFFSGLPINAGILILVLILVVVFQFMFLGIVKTKRPKVD